MRRGQSVREAWVRRCRLCTLNRLAVAHRGFNQGPMQKTRSTVQAGDVVHLQRGVASWGCLQQTRPCVRTHGLCHGLLGVGS